MKVLLTGSFDPVTKGHEDIILRAAKIFHEVVVGVFCNDEKEYLFSLEERAEICKAAFENNENIRVESSSGLVVSLCKKENCYAVVRGIRDSSDIAYEIYLNGEYKKAEPLYESIFMLADKKYSDISSSKVRKLISEGKDFSSLIPAGAQKKVNEILYKKKG